MAVFAALCFALKSLLKWNFVETADNSNKTFCEESVVEGESRFTEKSIFVRVSHVQLLGAFIII